MISPAPGLTAIRDSGEHDAAAPEMSAETQRGQARHAEHSVRALVVAAFVPAAVTALAFAPEFWRNPAEFADSPAASKIGWLAVLACAAPLAALAFNWLRPVATTAHRAMVIGLAQVVTLVVIVRLDVWLDVRSGYLDADTREDDMSYGLGMFVAVIGGLLLMCLVASAARLGARGRARFSRSSGWHQGGRREQA